MKRRIGEIGSNIAAKSGAGSNAVRFPPENKTRCWTRPIALVGAADRRRVSGGKVKATEPRLQELIREIRPSHTNTHANTHTHTNSHIYTQTHVCVYTYKHTNTQTHTNKLKARRVDKRRVTFTDTNTTLEICSEYFK